MKDLSQFISWIQTELKLGITADDEWREPAYTATHFKKGKFTLYEYAQIFGSSVEDGVKRVTHWSVHYYTRRNPCYLSEFSDAGQLVRTDFPNQLDNECSEMMRQR